MMPVEHGFPDNMAEQNYEDGYITVNGVKLYYKRYGKGNRYKLLTLHGGPGGTHDYLLSLKDLADKDFDVVFYDQFGCGKSDNPANESDYSLEYAVEEVEGVREMMFGKSRIHLFGNSWGGMLALAYGIKYQDHLKSLTSSSGLSSIKDTVGEMHRLISLLPEKYSSAIARHEKDGDYDNPEFMEASEYFMSRHLYRAGEMPEDVMRTMEMMEKRGTYLKMNGPSEFTIIGTIKDVDFTDRLDTIRVPVLLTCGRYDEVTPEIAEKIRGRIPGSRLVVFENSAHMQFWEERAKYMDTIARFVSEND